MPNTSLGFVFHSRHEWQTASQPVVGPAPRGDSRANAVCHYTGSTSGVTWDSAAFLRATQNDYLKNRGFSLGYYWFIDRNAEAWQIRGPHPDDMVFYNCAANPGDLLDGGNFNDNSCAILFPHGVPESIPEPVADTAVKLLRWHGFRGRPLPHRSTDPTGCPGDLAAAQIESGLLDVTDPTPPPPEPPTETEPVMPLARFTTTNRRGQFLIGTGMPVMLSAKMVEDGQPFADVPRVVGDGPDEDARWDEYQRIWFAAQQGPS